MRRRRHEEEHAGELNIVPYLDVVTNLVMFMLLSITGLIALGVVNVSAPKISAESAAAADAAAPRLLLTVAISKNGFYVAGAGGVLGGAADQPTVDAKQPPTVPLKDGKYDYGTLTELLARVKDRYPNETNVILSADPDISYDGKKVLFAYCRFYPHLVDVPDKTAKDKLPDDGFYHLYEMNIDGSGVRQLTRGRYDDFDGRYLPNGRIVFLSTRKGTALQAGKHSALANAQSRLVPWIQF